MNTGTALILGASSDIGGSLIERYLASGWRVIAHYNQPNSDLVRRFESTSEVSLFRLDLRDLSYVEKFLAQSKIIEEHRIDAFVNCVGYLQPQAFMQITPANLLSTISANACSAILFIQKIIPPMIEQKWGRVVSLGSIGVKFGGGATSYAYSLSKHMLEFFPTEYKSWAQDNVLLNTIRVGVTNTRMHGLHPGKNMSDRIKMIPMGRMAETSEIADFAFWLGSSSNTFITGEVLGIAGGE